MRVVLKILGILLTGIVIAGAVLIFLPDQVQYNATVQGIQYRSQIWTGTIRVSGDVLFLPWLTTLTIEPGTTVLFEKQPDKTETPWAQNADAYIKDHDDPTGRVGYGKTHFDLTAKITAVGTSDKPILFTSAQTEPEYADWDQLVLFGGSRLENVEVAYAHNGVNLNGNGTAIRNSTIHDSLWSCIDVFSTGNTIENNEAYHCWHQALGFKKPGPNVARGNFLHDAQLSVNCENGALPTLEQNTFTAAPFNPDCGSLGDNTERNRARDTAGGTYGGRLIYPSE